MVLIDARTLAGLESFGHVAAAERPPAHELGGKRTVERRRNALPRHVADGDHHRVRFRREVVVKVAADFARGIERRGHFDASQSLRRLGRQQRDLDALGEAHFLFEPGFVGAQLLVEPRVLDRDGGLAREQRQDLDVPLAEGVELGTLEIDDADAAVLDEHRDRELRAHVGDDLDIARILRHIGDEHRLAMERGVADEALAELDARQIAPLAELERELDLELAGLVEQQDAERPVVDQPLGELGDAGEELIEVEDRRHFLPISASVSSASASCRLCSKRRALTIATATCAATCRSSGNVVRREVILVAAEEIEGANRLRLVDERHDDLGRHAGDELDVARIGLEIVDDEGLLAGNGGARRGPGRASAGSVRRWRDSPPRRRLFSPPRRSSSR